MRFRTYSLCSTTAIQSQKWSYSAHSSRIIAYSGVLVYCPTSASIVRVKPLFCSVFGIFQFVFQNLEELAYIPALHLGIFTRYNYALSIG